MLAPTGPITAPVKHTGHVEARDADARLPDLVVELDNLAQVNPERATDETGY